MGRTNPTFRMLLEAVKRRWGDYRRALRRRDKSHFDQLFEYADRHADAAGYLNTDDEMDPILFSMLLEQEKRIAELEEHVVALADGTGGDEAGSECPSPNNSYVGNTYEGNNTDNKNSYVGNNSDSSRHGREE